MVTKRAAAHAREETLGIGVLLLAFSGLIDVVCKHTLSAAGMGALALILASFLLGTSAYGPRNIKASLPPWTSECMMQIALSLVFLTVELPEIVASNDDLRPKLITWTAVNRIIYFFYLPASDCKTGFIAMRCLELALCAALFCYSIRVAPGRLFGERDAHVEMAQVHEDAPYHEDGEHAMRVFGRLSLVSFHAWIVNWRVNIWSRKVSLDEQRCQVERPDTAGGDHADRAGEARVEGEDVESEQAEDVENWEGNEVDTWHESNEESHSFFSGKVERMWIEFRDRRQRKETRAAQKQDLAAFLSFARWNLLAQSSKTLPTLPPCVLLCSASFLCGRSSRKQRREMMKSSGGADPDGYDSDHSVDSGGSVSRTFTKVNRLIHAWW